MRFTPQFLDELRARLPVSEVVGRRVKLKKAGREWKGLSPFQQEKSPSFTVNDQKGFYHDFSSGKHGDVFRFLMETEGLSFPDAVERLAFATGLAAAAPHSATVADGSDGRRWVGMVQIAAAHPENTAIIAQRDALLKGFYASSP